MQKQEKPTDAARRYLAQADWRGAMARRNVPPYCRTESDHIQYEAEQLAGGLDAIAALRGAALQLLYQMAARQYATTRAAIEWAVRQEYEAGWIGHK